MVITSTTQWNIPLSGSSLSASSPSASSRQSSMLGLKTCQLSAPQHAMNSSEPRRHSHHQDLHSTSSRRLQGAENVISRRSAGSFRQLVPDEFFAKLGHAARRPPVSHEIGRDKEFERKYEGIAMPWGTSPLPALDIGTATGTALPGNLIDVHGDITADDVDLLPLPGLLSCSSHFTTAPAYVSHSESPKNSRNVESVLSESTGKISKASLIVPDYLGLPPELDTDVIAENRAPGWSCLVDSDVSVLQNPPIINEYAGCAGPAVSSAGRAHNGKDVDSFTDSLAGLWSIPAGADYMLQDSESLASIFNVYPQNFHSFSSAEQSFFDMRCTETAQPIMDDLHCFMNFSSDCCEEKGTGRDALHGFSPGRPTYSVNEYRDSRVWEIDRAHVKPSVVVCLSNASELKKSSVPASASDGSAVSYASSLSHSRSYAESPLKLIGESISLKRPFSALDLASMASSATSTGSCITGANTWFSSSEGMGTEGHEELLKRVAPIPSESQNDRKLDGNVHYLPAMKGDGSTGEMSPKPPPTKIRRKHGTAMDPQSVAARTRREKFSDRIRILQTLVPNGERLDTVSMLSQTLEYVKFLQHQVWHLYHGKDPASDTDTCEKWRDFVEAEPAPAN